MADYWRDWKLNGVQPFLYGTSYELNLGQRSKQKLTCSTFFFKYFKLWMKKEMCCGVWGLKTQHSHWIGCGRGWVPQRYVSAYHTIQTSVKKAEIRQNSLVSVYRQFFKGRFHYSLVSYLFQFSLSHTTFFLFDFWFLNNLREHSLSF